MAEKDLKRNGQRSVQSIVTGGRVLAALADAKGPVMLRDLGETTGLPPAQLHPSLVSFVTIGMVEQTERGHYRLGPFALRLGLARLQGQNAYRDTIARLADLSEDLGLMLSIAVWGAHGPTITYVQEYAARIHANVQVGGTYNMTVTATGPVFAAFLPRSMTEPVIQRELQDEEFRRRAFYEVDEAAFRAAVEQARARGYATTRDMPIPGVSAVAAPVFDHTGQMQLAVTAIGPTGLIDLADEGATVRGLLEFTGTLSLDLGYRADA